MADADAVVFDLGNVLVEWDRSRLYRTVIPDADLRTWFLDNVVNMAWNLELDRGLEFGRAVAERQQLYPEWADEIAAFRDRWSETLGPVDEDAVRLLGDLRAAGVPVYALTNWSGETFPIARSRFEWIGWFDGVVVSGEEGVVKPEAEIFERLRTRFDLTASRTVFTDDSPANIAGAVAAGFRAELWQGADGFRARLAALGVPGA